MKGSQAPGSAINDFKKRFEGLDFVDQAKVMRMTLDGNRFDRFMNLYDQRKTEMHQKIRKMGHHPLSKSVAGDRVEPVMRSIEKSIGVKIIEEEDQEDGLARRNPDLYKFALEGSSTRTILPGTSAKNSKTSMRDQPSPGRAAAADEPRHQSPVQSRDACNAKLDPEFFNELNVPVPPLGKISTR